MQLDGRTFLISGGASGLGAACARRFSAGGARVLVADVNTAAGEQLASELGDKVRFARTDVTDEASVQHAVDQALGAFGGLHGAINCAGIGVAQRTLGRNGPHPLADFVRVISVNLIGTFNVIRLTAAGRASRPDGRPGCAAAAPAQRTSGVSSGWPKRASADSIAACSSTGGPS